MQKGHELLTKTLSGCPSWQGFLFMKTLFFEEKEFRQYLETDIYSNESGEIISINFQRTGKTKYYKQNKLPSGYLRIMTSFNGKITGVTSHRIIATCWIPNPDNKEQVNHINGIKDDNRKVNLEWNTRSENGLHAFKTGLSVQLKGADHMYFGKRGSETVRAKKVIDIETNIVYGSLKEACLTTEFNYKYVSRMLTGEKKNKTNLRYV